MFYSLLESVLIFTLITDDNKFDNELFEKTICKKMKNNSAKFVKC